MFLTLNHQKLDVYGISRQFVSECYKITNKFPIDEKLGMVTQIRRAAVSVHLNIAEGSSRISKDERKRFYEVARGSLIEIDAALDIANDLGYLNKSEIENLGTSIINCFKTLTGMIGSRK